MDSEKMKWTAIGCIIVCAVFLVSAVNMPAVNAAINNFNWIGTVTRNNYDGFYGLYITAYEEGTSADLVVNVYNDYSYYGVPINVSAVKVGFDWGVNYTSSECSIDNPSSVSSQQSHVFTIGFTVPSALLASNLVTHSYTIYVEHVNSTTGNKGIVGTWTQSGSSFVVFSSDQADAYDYKKQVESYPSSTSFGLPIITANGRELMLKSNVARSLGSDAYTRGDFSKAKQYYKDSLDSIQQAWSNETEKWSTFENSLADLLRGGGNLLTFQGYAWLLFGIGFLLISIGALVYLLRRRPQPRTS
jgi:hypothetical protein